VQVVARIGLIPPFFVAHQNLFETAPDENSSGNLYKIAALRSGTAIDASVASASHDHWDRWPDKALKKALLRRKIDIQHKNNRLFFIHIYQNFEGVIFRSVLTISTQNSILSVIISISPRYLSA